MGTLPATAGTAGMLRLFGRVEESWKVEPIVAGQGEITLLRPCSREGRQAGMIKLLLASPLGARQILRGCWLAKEKCNLLNRSVSTRKQRMEDGLRVNNQHKCLLLISPVDSHWFNFPTVPLGAHFLPAQISSCSGGQSQFNTP